MHFREKKAKLTFQIVLDSNVKFILFNWHIMKYSVFTTFYSNSRVPKMLTFFVTGHTKYKNRLATTQPVVYMQVKSWPNTTHFFFSIRYFFFL